MCNNSSGSSSSNRGGSNNDSNNGSSNNGSSNNSNNDNTNDDNNASTSDISNSSSHALASWTTDDVLAFVRSEVSKHLQPADLDQLVVFITEKQMNGRALLDTIEPDPFGFGVEDKMLWYGVPKDLCMAFGTACREKLMKQ